MKRKRVRPAWFAPAVLVSAVSAGGLLGFLFALAAE
jgi:hypothetical protein